LLLCGKGPEPMVRRIDASFVKQLEASGFIKNLY
jgi:hypothetical protein